MLLFSIIFTSNTTIALTNDLANNKMATAICKGCKVCCNGVAGAGVLVATPSKKISGDMDLILVMDQSGTYNDFGGTARDRHGVDKEPHNVASSEINEESRKTIQVSGAVLTASHFVDLVGRGHIYRCFIVPIQNVSCSAFYHSKNHIVIKGHQFNETTRMTRFPLGALVSKFKKTNLVPDHITSDSGESCKINGRIQGILRLLLPRL